MNAIFFFRFLRCRSSYNVYRDVLHQYFPILHQKKTNSVEFELYYRKIYLNGKVRSKYVITRVII